MIDELVRCTCAWGEAAVAAAHEVLRTAPSAQVHVKRMGNERYGLIDQQTMDWAPGYV